MVKIDLKRAPGVFHRAIFPILLLSLASGCFVISTPDWIGGSSRDYPNGSFLIGVGTGDTRKAAEDDAMETLSRNFRVDVRRQTQELEKYIQQDAGRRALMSRSVNIDQLTTITSDKVLEEAVIEAVWRHPKTGQFHALALIERVHAESMLLKRIREVDQAVKAYLDPARSSGDKIQTLRAINQALKALFLRETLNTDLRVISPSGRGLVAPVTLARVNEGLQEFLKTQLRIAVEVGGLHAEAIRGSFLQSLSEKGFYAPESGPEDETRPAKPDLLIRGTVAFEPAEQPDHPGIRWSADFQILEAETGRVLGGLVKSGRAEGAPGEAAEAAAVRAVQREFGRDFTQYLIDLLYGETEIPG